MKYHAIPVMEFDDLTILGQILSYYGYGQKIAQDILNLANNKKMNRKRNN